ncbi:MAG: diaminopimelate decarboxylase [Calditrichia bacterium]
MFKKSVIEKLNRIQTPFYFYDLDMLRQNLARLSDAAGQSGYKIHYALKANVDVRILEQIRAHGLGADCVSGNEVGRALETGFQENEIVFAGVGKTDREIRYALQNNIHSFNCESLQELEVIEELANELDTIAPVALRLNPNLEANTHHYITTGREENKFGIPFRDLDRAVALLGQLQKVKLIGIHFHIGSQITDLMVYENLCRKVNELQNWFEKRNVPLPNLNLGGGLGIDYVDPDENPVPDYKSFFKIFKENLEVRSGQIVHFELGRSVVGQCGTLFTRVLYEKESGETAFAITDAGMTELIRPALYGAYHKIENLTSKSAAVKEYDVVGPICESSDFLGKGVLLPETGRGDLLAIRSAGAYAQVMASRYNLREPAAVVYSDEL